MWFRCLQLRWLIILKSKSARPNKIRMLRYRRPLTSEYNTQNVRKEKLKALLMIASRKATSSLLWAQLRTGSACTQRIRLNYQSMSSSSAIPRRVAAKVEMSSRSSTLENVKVLLKSHATNRMVHAQKTISWWTNAVKTKMCIVCTITVSLRDPKA